MFDRQRNIQLITDTMNLQAPLLEPFHDSSEHKYQEIMGTCKICGWFHTENTPTLPCCGKTLRQHVEEFQQRMKYLKEYIISASDENLRARESSLKAQMRFVTRIYTHLKEGESIRELYTKDSPHTSN